MTQDTPIDRTRFSVKLDKKMSGRWADVTATRVPFFPTSWLEHNPALYDDARRSAALPQGNNRCG